ncbi:response regulator transcription factor [Fulvivirga maritima]|uniref:response regulator transcription factor n=1 Tax=Fulvivirga maritima TaxID=2904247 RepID=UPI001F369480|nr:response regulator transcription factor [Fulvivirga maritima]UII28066.1 response regulator transcription factor [Fulvivirga maritima]
MENKIKLLIVEDDQNLGQILKEYLQLKGYKADLYRDGESGLQAFSPGLYDLCILDIMMPKRDGFSLAQEIRNQDKNIPLVFLTAKSMKEDAIKGLTIGADDYVTKPFSMEELLLRLKAILRRSAPIAGEQPAEFNIGDYKFDPTRRILDFKGDTTKLTTKENDLLTLLCKHQNKVLSRKIALNSIWGDDSYFNARSMDVYITKLRKYLKKDESLQILTVHGEGFKLINL